jgi:hypothetical protein
MRGFDIDTIILRETNLATWIAAGDRVYENKANGVQCGQWNPITNRLRSTFVILIFSTDRSVLSQRYPWIFERGTSPRSSALRAVANPLFCVVSTA